MTGRTLFAFLSIAMLASARPIRREDLESCLRNAGVDVLVPADPAYQDAALPYNRRYEDLVPAGIAYPNSTAQVAAAVQCASSLGIKVAARGGGHSYVAQSLNTGALTIDMSRLNAITVQLDGTASIGGGAKLGDVALSLYEQGQRAMGHGTCPWVGLGGHGVSGGFGLASRSLGLSIDRITGHEVVLANGTIVDTANDDDLRWALRGGGGSFGIVTSFRVQTAAAPPNNTIATHSYDLSASDAAQMLKAYQQWALNDAPSEITAEINAGKGSSQGRVSFDLVYQCLSDQTTCEGLIAPLLAQLPAQSSDPVIKSFDWEGALAYLAAPQALNTTVARDISDNFVEASLMTPASQPMSDDALTAFANYLANEGFNADSSWFMQVEQYGGANSAISAVPVDDTAFVSRDTLFTMQLYTSRSDKTQNWPSSGADFVSGARSSIVNSMPSSWPWATYANYVDTILPTSEYLNRTYGAHLQRLVSTKNRVDPSNLIQFATSIPLSL